MALGAVQNAYLNQDTSLTCAPGTAERVDAVSYTHLDVYKRQRDLRARLRQACAQYGPHAAQPGHSRCEQLGSEVTLYVTL